MGRPQMFGGLAHNLIIGLAGELGVAVEPRIAAIKYAHDSTSTVSEGGAAGAARRNG
jgi:hypothetical protein